MGTASIHEGVRRMRFSSLLDRTEAKELTQEAASEILGINVRTFQRWAERYEAEGDDGLVDRRMGRRSPKRAPEEELERMLGLFRDKYADFTVKHFHEQLQKRHGYVLGYTVTKLALHAAGLVRKAPKRSAHRKKRPRRPLRGMLLHQDGSRHDYRAAAHVLMSNAHEGQIILSDDAETISYYLPAGLRQTLQVRTKVRELPASEFFLVARSNAWMPLPQFPHRQSELLAEIYRRRFDQFSHILRVYRVSATDH